MIGKSVYLGAKTLDLRGGFPAERSYASRILQSGDKVVVSDRLPELWNTV